MTITDIGILLIILCVLLWAIMAALHRHTVQLETLRKQIEALQAQPPRAPDHADDTPAAQTRDEHADLGVPPAHKR